MSSCRCSPGSVQSTNRKKKTRRGDPRKDEREKDPLGSSVSLTVHVRNQHSPLGTVQVRCVCRDLRIFIPLSLSVCLRKLRHIIDVDGVYVHLTGFGCYPNVDTRKNRGRKKARYIFSVVLYLTEYRSYWCLHRLLIDFLVSSMLAHPETCH